MAIYVTNIVALIGLAIAVDYSMLVVFRFREELAHTDDVHEALKTTMATAGRATLFSGMVVAIGLALLVFMPLPFMRSMGVGGLLVPLVSIAASATLLPALLAMLGRGVNRFRIIPRACSSGAPQKDVTGGWHRLAMSIMRRPVLVLRRCRRADAGARAARAQPRADRRRQPRRAADDGVDTRPARASRRRSARARSRRTRS